MTQELFTEIRPIYTTRRDRPSEIRIRIRMRDLIDGNVLRNAVDTTMGRYPYFCVEFQEREGKLVFAENSRPVVITNSLHGVELNTAESNYHMISFSYYDNWIIMDVFHGMTDGTGAYEVVRTLLYYYCSERYNIKLAEEGIRLVEDAISPEEWTDPIACSENLPQQGHSQFIPALRMDSLESLKDDHVKTVYSISVSESEFMGFSMDNDGSPGTLVSLFLSRAIAKLFPDATAPIRVALCVNLRRVLHAPAAHHSLVGGAILEYKEKMRSWSLSRQATAYRGMVFAQTMDEVLLSGVASNRGMTQMLLSRQSHAERKQIAAQIDQMSDQLLSATVSYVGKANFKGAESYIRDFRLWTSPVGNSFLIEISAVNGKFTLDVIQPFASPVYVNAFLKELEENGITYDLQDVQPLELPNISFPWNE